jgi:hypothetical protein
LGAAVFFGTLKYVTTTNFFSDNNKKIMTRQLARARDKMKAVKENNAAAVPYSKSGIVPRSSLLGAGQLGFWEVGKGGTIG